MGIYQIHMVNSVWSISTPIAGVVSLELYGLFDAQHLPVEVGLQEHALVTPQNEM